MFGLTAWENRSAIKKKYFSKVVKYSFDLPSLQAILQRQYKRQKSLSIMTAILKTSSWYGGLSGSDSKGESEDVFGWCRFYIGTYYFIDCVWWWYHQWSFMNFFGNYLFLSFPLIVSQYFLLYLRCFVLDIKEEKGKNFKNNKKILGKKLFYALYILNEDTRWCYSHHIIIIYFY